MDQEKQQAFDEYFRQKYGEEYDQLSKDQKSEEELKRQKGFALATDAIGDHARGANEAINTLLYAFTGDKGVVPSARARAESAMDRYRGTEDQQAKIKQYLAKMKGKASEEFIAEEKQKAKDAIAAEGRKQDQENWQKTFDQRGEQIAATNANTQARLAQQKTEKQEKVAEKKEKEVNRQVEKVQDDLGPSQNLTSAIAEVENQIGFNLDLFDPASGTVSTPEGSKSVDLPGVNWPMAGRISFYSKDARNLDKAASKIFNIELKNRSGAAVTTPEMERLKREFGDGKYNTEEELLSAMKLYKDELRRAMRDIEAGYTPEAIATYKDRGGRVSETAFRKDGVTKSDYLDGSGTAVAGSAPPVPSKALNEMTPEEKDAYEKELDAYLGGQ